MRYSGGASRKAFESYLRRVYGLASTYSLSREMQQRPLADMQPGDVFVYAAVDRPGNHKYGHAVMVVDVAVNKSGKKEVKRITSFLDRYETDDSYFDDCAHECDGINAC